MQSKTLSRQNKSGALSIAHPTRHKGEMRMKNNKNQNLIALFSQFAGGSNLQLFVSDDINPGGNRLPGNPPPIKNLLLKYSKSCCAHCSEAVAELGGGGLMSHRGEIHVLTLCVPCASVYAKAANPVRRAFETKCRQKTLAYISEPEEAKR